MIELTNLVLIVYFVIALAKFIELFLEKLKSQLIDNLLYS